MISTLEQAAARDRDLFATHRAEQGQSLRR